MKISLAQISSVPDVSANLDMVCEYIKQAATDGARLVVFPEATMHPFDAGRLDSIAEPLDGNFAQTIRTTACAAGVVAVVGMFCPADTITTDDGDRHRIDNAVLVVGRDGVDGDTVETVYRKIHCYDAFGYKESETVRPGTELVTFTCGGMTFGLSTCFDIRFPEQFKELARCGAEAVLVPTSWSDGPGKLEQWRTLTAARALDSTSWIVASGQARPGGVAEGGKPDGPTGIGHSVVVGPDGRREIELGYGKGFVTVDIDSDRVKTVRKAIPVL